MARMEEKSDTGPEDALKEWKQTYSKWVELLLDRQRLKKRSNQSCFHGLWTG